MIWAALALGCTAGPGSAALPDESTPVDCPPAGPTGLEPGVVAQDVAFTACDGEARSLAGLCGAPALVANWYGWCPSCEDNASLARDLADEHPELAVAIALDEDPLSAPVTPALCEEYAATYPSSAQIWMDPAGNLEVYGTTDLVLVLARDGTLVFARNDATEAAIVAAVDGVL